MSRSAFWKEVAGLAERSRERRQEFDFDTGTPEHCVRQGVAPIVALYVRTRRAGVSLSDVERSLLEGELNDWLAAYAACHGGSVQVGRGYTVDELARALASGESLEVTVRELLLV